MTACAGTECVTRWRDLPGSLQTKRYVACATCGMDVTEADDPFAEKVGRPPRTHDRPAWMDEAERKVNAARPALAVLGSLDEQPPTDGDCAEWCYVREALLFAPDERTLGNIANEESIPVGRCAELLDAIDRLTETELFEVRLSFSLCPVHGGDYAICFDDDDPECATVREAHPEHDT